MDKATATGLSSSVSSATRVPKRYPSHQCRGAKSFVDDLGFGRGVVLSRAATSLRSIETKPFDWKICPHSRRTHLREPAPPRSEIETVVFACLLYYGMAVFGSLDRRLWLRAAAGRSSAQILLCQNSSCCQSQPVQPPARPLQSQEAGERERGGNRKEVTRFHLWFAGRGSLPWLSGQFFGRKIPPAASRRLTAWSTVTRGPVDEDRPLRRPRRPRVTWFAGCGSLP